MRDRLAPQNISFPPAEAMTPEETAEVGDFAGREGRHGHRGGGFLAVHRPAPGRGMNEGATYSETSSAAREEGLDADVAAELQGKADTLFKGETLRSMLLNAYGWWTVSTIAVFAGYAMVIAGCSWACSRSSASGTRGALHRSTRPLGEETAARSRKGLAAGRRLTPSAWRVAAGPGAAAARPDNRHPSCGPEEHPRCPEGALHSAWLDDSECLGNSLKRRSSSPIDVTRSTSSPAGSAVLRTFDEPG